MVPTTHEHTHESHAAFAHPPRNVALFGIEPGMKVADFGSGSGAYALLMAEHLKGEGAVYAIDVQRDLLRKTHNETLKRKLHVLSVMWGDVERPGGSKLADRSLDLVLVSNLLFQVEDRSALFTEARRVLRDGGRLIVIDWSDSFGGMGPEQKTVVTKEKALELAQDAGFSLERAFEAGAHHWGLILSAQAAQ